MGSGIWPETNGTGSVLGEYDNGQTRGAWFPENGYGQTTSRVEWDGINLNTETNIAQTTNHIRTLDKKGNY